MHIFLKCLKFEHFQFLFEIWSRGFYMFEKFEMPHLRVIVFENGTFQIFRAYKNHAIRFWIEKLEVFEFEAFQKNMRVT